MATSVVKLQEYDIDIKLTNLVRGKGLCKLIAENISITNGKEELPQVLLVGLTNSWFSKVAYYLTYEDCLEGMSPRERRDLKLKFAKYVVTQGVLYKK